MSELLTVKELAIYLKVSQATVYDWVHRRIVPHYKIGRHLRFNIVEFSEQFQIDTVDDGACLYPQKPLNSLPCSLKTERKRLRRSPPKGVIDGSE